MILYYLKLLISSLGSGSSLNLSKFSFSLYLSYLISFNSSKILSKGNLDLVYFGVKILSSWFIIEWNELWISISIFSYYLVWSNRVLEVIFSKLVSLYYPSFILRARYYFKSFIILSRSPLSLNLFTSHYSISVAVFSTTVKISQTIPLTNESITKTVIKWNELKNRQLAKKSLNL